MLKTYAYKAYKKLIIDLPELYKTTQELLAFFFLSHEEQIYLKLAVLQL